MKVGTLYLVWKKVFAEKLSQIWGACSLTAIQSATIMNDE